MLRQNSVNSPDDISEKIYKFIVDYVTENLYSPSIAEIQQAVYADDRTVCSQLSKLEQEGKIKRAKHTRGITLVGYRLVKVGISGYKDKVRQGLLELQV